MAVNLSLDDYVFRAYIFYSMVVILKMVLIPLVLTVPLRFKKDVYMFPEDHAYFGKKKQDDVVLKEDPDIERSRRNHHHDLENIPVFVIVGAFYVLCQPTPWIALWHFRAYAVSKVLHSVSYQLAMQPWRGLFHTIGYSLLLSMSFQVLAAAL